MFEVWWKVTEEMTLRNILSRLSDFDFGVLLDLSPVDFVSLFIIPFILIGIFFLLLYFLIVILQKIYSE